MKILRNKITYLIGLLSLLTLTGCSVAPQQPDLALNTDILSQQETKIGIHFVEPEDKATTHIWGANCLLCYGVASALTQGLDDHLEQEISTEELDNIKELVLAKYSARFPNVKMVELSTPVKELKDFKEQLGFAKKDFTVVKGEHDIDVLVIMHVRGYGAFRSFSNYIPNGDPQGYLAGWLYSVDLNTNAYIQYLSLDEKVQPSGVWDQPPKYPSVTTAYYQAVENVKKKIDNAL